jgi:hypothetical protein
VGTTVERELTCSVNNSGCRSNGDKIRLVLRLESFTCQTSEDWLSARCGGMRVVYVVVGQSRHGLKSSFLGRSKRGHLVLT